MSWATIILIGFGGFFLLIAIGTVFNLIVKGVRREIQRTEIAERLKFVGAMLFIATFFIAIGLLAWFF